MSYFAGVWVIAQREDPSLKSLFDAVLSPAVEESSANGYFIENEVLLRKWTFHAEGGLTEPTIQVVVPVSLQNTVLESAHGGVSGHFGVNKTYQHLMQYFYWPHIKSDVREFINLFNLPADWKTKSNFEACAFISHTCYGTAFSTSSSGLCWAFTTFKVW